MDIYIPNQNDIIHETSVDFVLRPCSKEIHIVQYDKSLPIIKVELFKNGERYALPENAAVNVRVGKLDYTFVYESILGTNEERTVIYFEVSEQMALIPGRIWPVIEVIEGSKVACSSPLYFIIDKNPIQEGQIESHSDFPIIYELQGTVADHETRITALESQVGGDFVTLHTNQYNIDGEKTFKNNVFVSDQGGLFLYFTPTNTNHAVNKGYVDSVVENIEIRSDVIDIVGTYQDLQNYDTTDVRLNDLIKVISDSTHSNATSYYRWETISSTNQWNFVASEGPYYTISQSDAKFVSKASYDAISGDKDFTGWINFNMNGTTAAVRTTQTPTNNNDITPKWYIDNALSAYVTLATAQSISAKHTFTNGFNIGTQGSITSVSNLLTIKVNTSEFQFSHSAFAFQPRAASTPTLSLGSTSSKWKDLYLRDTAYFGSTTNSYIKEHETENTLVIHGNVGVYITNTNETPLFVANGIQPTASGENLGHPSVMWNNLYLSGVITDGTNSVSVANIQDKTKGIPYLTTAPTADNTDGLKFVVLSSEPATKYNGYIYIITESTPQGYSGNITTYQGDGGNEIETYIKFDTPPTSDNDCDAFVDKFGTPNGLTSYSNKTKVYVWSSTTYYSAVSINNVETTGGVGYANAVEVILTGNYDIALKYQRSGGSND